MVEKLLLLGIPEEVIASTKSLTGDYLSGRQIINVPNKRKHATEWLKIQGASGNNLKEVDLAIPVGLLTCITGVSGSGKSTLINNTLYPVSCKNIESCSS